MNVSIARGSLTRCLLQFNELLIGEERPVVNEFERVRRITRRAHIRLGDASTIDFHLNVKATRIAREVGRAKFRHDQRRSNDHTGQAHQLVDILTDQRVVQTENAFETNLQDRDNACCETCPHCRVELESDAEAYRLRRA